MMGYPRRPLVCGLLLSKIRCVRCRMNGLGFGRRPGCSCPTSLCAWETSSKRLGAERGRGLKLTGIFECAYRGEPG